MASQGTVPVYELVRGVTLPAITITFAVNGSAPPFASAQFSVANKNGDVFYTAACTLSDGTGTKNVTTPGALPVQTRSWPLGEVFWSVHTTTDSEVEKEYVKGTYQILPSPQPR